MALSDHEYSAALAELADYERRIAESDRLSQRDSLKVAEVLDRLYRDERWVAERNADRQATAKTTRGAANVDPMSRSQFSTWVRNRKRENVGVPPLAPSTTYRLLDAHSITSKFLANGERQPTAEYQTRPLKSLLSVANGQGSRIPEVWDLACKLASEAGRDQPTSEDVKHGIQEWRRLHLPPAQQREERASDRAWLKERRAVAAWRELFAAGADEHINAFLDTVREDMQKWQADHAA